MSSFLIYVGETSTGEIHSTVIVFVHDQANLGGEEEEEASFPITLCSLREERR